MTAHGQDDDRTLVAWLVDGIDIAPPRAVRSALEQVATTRQRRELAVVRRVHNMEATGPLNRNGWLRLGVVGMAGILAALAVLAGVNLLLRGQAGPVSPVGSASPTASASATASLNPATTAPVSTAPATPMPPQITTSAQVFIDGLPAPEGTRTTNTMQGRAALAALATRSGVAPLSQIQQPDAASAVLFDASETGDHRAYTASALTFASPDAASSAMRSIQTGLSSAVGMWAGGNSPFTDEHLPPGRDEGFERSGTWWAFGGTSASASSRVGHMNVWRVGDVVFVVFCVDFMTVGTAEYQSTIEAGVISLSEYLTDQAR